MKQLLQEKNNLGIGEIIIKAFPKDYNNNLLSLYLTAEEVSINWGDGCSETYYSQGKTIQFQHQYQDSEMKIILIKTQKLTEVGHLIVELGHACHNIGQGEYVEIHFGKCPELKEIHCGGDAVSIIDVEKNNETLEIFKCPSLKLEEINLKNFSKLKELDCNGSYLHKLDLEGCKSLVKLDCSYNWNLEFLNLTDCFLLEDLDCRGNSLTELNLENCKKMKVINFQGTHLLNWEIFDFPYLEKFNSSSSTIESLHIYNCPNLREIDCSGSNLKYLNIENCSSVEDLNCSVNFDITKILINDCKNLNKMYCSYNNLSENELNDLFNRLAIRKKEDNAEITFHDNIGSDSCNQDMLIQKGWNILVEKMF